MFSKLSLALGALAIAGAVQNAPIIESNAPGVLYQATLPESGSSSIRGYITGASNYNGTGVVFSVNFQDFPSSGGPFLYHIHENPVSADGNCTSTGAHLDPTDRGEDPPCVSDEPETCQVGDLAGKHGHITADPWQEFYLDLFVSSTPGNLAYFGNRSITIHSADKTRLTCANFTIVPCGGESSSPGSTGSATVSTIAATAAATTAVSSAAAIAASSSNAALLGTDTGSMIAPTGSSTAPFTQVTGSANVAKGVSWGLVGGAAGLFALAM